MSNSHLPRDKKDRSVRARKHDLYKAKGKLLEPSMDMGPCPIEELRPRVPCL